MRITCHRIGHAWLLAAVALGLSTMLLEPARAHADELPIHSASFKITGRYNVSAKGSIGLDDVVPYWSGGRFWTHHVVGNAGIPKDNGDPIGVRISISRSRFETAYRGEIELFDVVQGLRVTFNMEGAKLTQEGDTLTFTKEWNEWQQICGFVSCFWVPVWNTITFSVNPRTGITSED